MTKIVKLDTSRKKPKKPETDPASGCEHRQVTAYTAYRTVRCTICGALLDPFDVLVEVLKGYPPPDPGREEKRMLAEVARRKTETAKR